MIRRAKPSDIDALSALAIQTYVAAFGHTFTPADLAAHLAQNLAPANFARMLDKDIVLVADANERIIGYVQFGNVDTAFENAAANAQELRRIYVDTDWLNKGVGTRLMNAAFAHPQLAHAASIYLDVWEHNHAAQRFYTRYGFEVIGRRAFAVESGAETSSDLIMVRHTV